MINFCIAAVVGLVIVLTSQPAFTQTSLPKPSRSVFKCLVNGKTTYADAPCEGAVRVEVEPTRGLNKTTGKELTGADVARERQREAFAEAVRPLTGLSARQMDVQRKRIDLKPEAKRECAALDTQIARSESNEASAVGSGKDNAQSQLFQLRKRFQMLGC